MKLHPKLLKALDYIGCVTTVDSPTTINGVTYLRQQCVYWPGLACYAISLVVTAAWLLTLWYFMGAPR